LTKEDLSNLLALGEGFTIEFKRAGTSNVGREICAFANATGGVILIGVTDASEVVGVGHHNRLKSEVQSTARSAEPPIAIDVESIGEVLCITVPEQHSKPYSFGGKFFIREGATSQQMARNEIR
jgi:ATP-dependent DNA helicase RecG